MKKILLLACLLMVLASASAATREEHTIAEVDAVAAAIRMLNVSRPAGVESAYERDNCHLLSRKEVLEKIRGKLSGIEAQFDAQMNSLNQAISILRSYEQICQENKRAIELLPISSGVEGERHDSLRAQTALAELIRERKTVEDARRTLDSQLADFRTIKLFTLEELDRQEAADRQKAANRQKEVWKFLRSMGILPSVDTFLHRIFRAFM